MIDSKVEPNEVRIARLRSEIDRLLTEYNPLSDDYAAEKRRIEYMLHNLSLENLSETYITDLSYAVYYLIGAVSKDATFIVAAADSRHASNAHYQCTGVNDEAVINEAIEAFRMYSYSPFITPEVDSTSTLLVFKSEYGITAAFATLLGQSMVVSSATATFVTTVQDSYASYVEGSGWRHFVVPGEEISIAGPYTTVYFRRQAGEIVLLDGTYNIGSPIILPTGANLRGQGDSTVLLQAGVDATYNPLIVDGGDYGAAQCSIRNLVLDLNYDGEQPAWGRGIYGYFNRTIVDSVRVAHGNGDGIVFFGDGNIVSRSSVETRDAIGLVSYNGISVLGERNSVVACRVDGVPYGIYVSGNHNTVAENRVINSGTAGIFLGTGFGNSVRGNILYDSYGTGIRIGGLASPVTQFKVTNNIIRSGDNSPASGILVVDADSIEDGLITDNDLYDCSLLASIVDNSGGKVNYGSGNRLLDGTWYVGPA